MVFQYTYRFYLYGLHVLGSRTLNPKQRNTFCIISTIRYFALCYVLFESIT